MRKLVLCPSLFVILASTASLASAATVSCSTSVACTVFANNSTGPGVEGASAQGVGALGETSSGSFEGAGIEGESLDHTGSDAAGAFGLTLLSSGVAPNYGVLGYGSLYGVYGQAGNTGLSSTGPGYGVFGQDNAGSKNADYNSGVTGLSAYGTGIFALAAGSPSLGVAGTGTPIGLYAVGDTDGSSKSAAYGIFAESNSAAVIAANTYNVPQVQQHTLVTALATTGYFIDASFVKTSGNTATTTTEFSVDQNGDGVFAGTLTASEFTVMSTKGSSGAVVDAYGENTTTPELEDVGYGQLANGRAVVKFDAALADVTDVRPGYHVFLTPDGDCNGLYVESKTAAGFVVRELHGGRSTSSFEYRIVAKPLRSQGQRLAHVTAADTAVVPIGTKPVHLPLPLSPEQRMKNQIGTTAYAKLMLTLRNRLTANH